MHSVIIAFEVPEVGILEVQSRLSMVISRHRYFWLYLNFVHSFVSREADKRVLNVTVIVELNLFQDVRLSRARIDRYVLFLELQVVHGSALLQLALILFFLFVPYRLLFVVFGLGLGAGYRAGVLVVILPLLLFELDLLLLMAANILLTHHELNDITFLIVEALLLRQPRQLLVIL